jgi:hypothetical protein
MVGPLDARLDANSAEEGLVDGKPLGLTNPLLSPEPLGQNLLSPKFLMPVAAEPLMATNPSMLFPGGIPGYQPPENPFQESPFFAETRISPKIGEALALPEILQGSRSVPRPLLSDQLGDLESQTNFEAPAESPEPTSNEVGLAEVPTLEKEFEGTEGREIQPVPPREVEVPTSPQVERKELVEALSETELSPSSSESSSNPLSVPAVSEENYVADSSPSEPIAAESSLQKTELAEPTVVFSSASEELGSPTVAQPKESLEATEPAVISEGSEQPSDLEVIVSPERESAQENPELMATASFPPTLREEIITSSPETITPEPEPLPTSPTTTSVAESTPEKTEPAVVSKLPELIGQPSDIEVPASPETEPAQENPELTVTASSPPALREEIITSSPETITPEPEPLPTSTTATSVESGNLNLKQIAPEAEKIPKSPDFTAVQNAAEAVQPTPLEPENLAPAETQEVRTSEELSSVTEPAVVSKLPELIGQPSDMEVPASPETAPVQENPEPMATASSPPALREEIITSSPETITSESEPLPTSPTATSVESGNLNLKQIAPEAEKIPELPDFTAVQNAAGAVQPTPLEPGNLAPSETLEAITSEELSSVAEQAREETKPFPEELSNEAPVVPPEEAASKIAETPVSNPEIIAAEREEPVTESTLSLAEPEATLSIPAKSEPVEGLESPEPLLVSELLQTPEQLPRSEEQLGSPGEVVPAIEPLVAAQIPSGGAVPSEPIAAMAQEMAVPETPISPENEPEASPPISRTQELIERQIEGFSVLEQEEETVPSALAVPTVNEENTPKTAVEENAPLEIPALESVATTTAESTEEFTPRSNPPESLGIITPLTAAPPLAQLSNFLPITSEPFSSESCTEMPLGLEQPMTFVSPNNFRPSTPQEQQPLVPPVAIPESSPVINLSVSESIEENVPTTSQEIDNPKNEPTETISTSPQEEPPSQSETSNRIALPVQLNEESFRPLIFAPRLPISAQTNVQKTPDSDFSPSSNRVTEQHHEVTSFMHSYSSEINEGPGSTFVSMSSEGEHVASHKEGPEISTGEMGGRELHKPDLEAIAQEIYGLLRQRLEIERERQGHYSGRLPW